MNQISIFRGGLILVMVAGLTSLVWGRSVMNETQQLDQNCPLFSYYDHGTDSCEECRGMCEHHERVKTTRACFTDCPDYMAAQQCQADEYYNEHLKACSSCQQLCHDIQIAGHSQPCRTLCSDYIQSSEEQSGLEVVTDHKPSQSTPSDWPAKDPEIHDAPNSQAQPVSTWVIPLVSGVVVLAALIVVMVVLVRRSRLNPPAVKYTPASTSDEGSTDGSVQTQSGLKYPQAESRPGPDGRLVVSGT